MLNSDYNLRRLAVVLKDSNDAITIQDLFGNIKAWNKGAETLYGYTEQEALSMHISKLMLENFKRNDLEYIELIANGKRVPSFETQRISKSGKVLDVWIVVTCLRNDSGVVESLATTERDITDIKNEIRKKEKELKVLKSLLPICSHCREIRDDEGSWHKLENYISIHSETKFSHCICPNCARKFYPELDIYNDEE